MEAADIIDDSTEDPEERRKRIEAEENSSNIGALIGLTVGVVSGLTHSDEYVSESETEKSDFTMKM